jgi:hypothetical protein
MARVGAGTGVAGSRYLLARGLTVDKTMDSALTLRDALRPTEAPSVTSSPRPTTRAGYRADIGGATAAGDVLTRIAAVLLSSVNAVMWQVYTESRFMAAVWAIIAIAVSIWIKRDASRR